MYRERERLTVLMLPEHKQALLRLAQAQGEPVAVVVRGLIRREAQRRGLWPPAERGERKEARDDE